MLSVAGSKTLERYWRESARPLASLLFVIPMLLAYEASVLLLGKQATRNGADVWLRGWLDGIGFGQYFLLPALTCGLLLAWHHMRRDQWKIEWSVCYGMLVESALFGALLLLVANVQGSLFTASVGTPAGAQVGRLLGFFGAGIYEELLFRLILLPPLITAFQWLGAARTVSVVAAVTTTSLLFAAAHYQIDIDILGLRIATAHGESFQWFSFTFRCLAGVFFSILFVFRGFGIAAGSHALYDILVVLV